MWFNYAHKLLAGVMVLLVLYHVLPTHATAHPSFTATFARATDATNVPTVEETPDPRSTSVPATPVPAATDVPNPPDAPAPTDVPTPTDVPATSVPVPTNVPAPSNTPEPTDTTIPNTPVPTMVEPSVAPTTTSETPPTATSERSTHTPDIPPTHTPEHLTHTPQTQTPTSQATIQPTTTNEVTPTLIPTETLTPTTTLDTCMVDAQDALSAQIIGRGKVRFENHSTKCSYPVGIAAYSIPSGNPNDPDIDAQMWFADSEQNGVPYELGPAADAEAPNEQVLEIPTPLCDAIQLDAFVGEALKSLNGQRYGSRLLTAGRYAPAKTDCDELTGQVIFDQNSRMTCLTHADYIVVEGAVVLQPEEKHAQLQLTWHTQMPETHQSSLQSKLMEVRHGDDFEVNIPWPGVPQETEVEMVNVLVEGVLLNESDEQIAESYSSSGIYWYDWLECQAPQLPPSPTNTIPPSSPTPVPSATGVRSTATPEPSTTIIPSTATPESSTTAVPSTATPVPSATAHTTSDVPPTSKPRRTVTPEPANSTPYHNITVPEKATATPQVATADIPIEQLSIEPTVTTAASVFYKPDPIPARLPDTSTTNNTPLFVLFGSGVLIVLTGVYLRWRYRRTNVW
ncbi:MAG: hypothetical protein GFH25_541192n252 [Chloroflexi bacterium AL-N10]|nr:hypothetical protein [Chloroflexi bacterium AL-N1]NOK67784.1 hypothetical protein [Chloroflexi bacterium AL-N10]NOK75446.1 hypothetical protein [Chloroflexi bacterium AL-N5]NOK90079.1 hypothetical protein [Chloroflexi bacterium AL-N15]